MLCPLRNTSAPLFTITHEICAPLKSVCAETKGIEKKKNQEMSEASPFQRMACRKPNAMLVQKKDYLATVVNAETNLRPPVSGAQAARAADE